MAPAASSAPPAQQPLALPQCLRVAQRAQDGVHAVGIVVYTLCPCSATRSHLRKGAFERRHPAPRSGRSRRELHTLHACPTRSCRRSLTQRRQQHCKYVQVCTLVLAPFVGVWDGSSSTLRHCMFLCPGRSGQPALRRSELTCRWTYTRQCLQLAWQSPAERHSFNHARQCGAFERAGASVSRDRGSQQVRGDHALLLVEFRRDAVPSAVPMESEARTLATVSI